VEEGVGGVGRRREEEAAAEKLPVEGERGTEVEPRGGGGGGSGEERREGEVVGEERLVGAEEGREEGEEGGEGDARAYGAECGVEGEDRQGRR
jgi:hypothetical protein